METQNIEYKQSWKDEYLKYVCGFANAQGGTLYIGITDNGEICGVKNPTELLENLPNKINLTMGVVADVNLLKEGEKEYISITVKPTDRAISLRGKY